jgi:hypothetical protein
VKKSVLQLVLFLVAVGAMQVSFAGPRSCSTRNPNCAAQPELEKIIVDNPYEVCYSRPKPKCVPDNAGGYPR